MATAVCTCHECAFSELVRVACLARRLGVALAAWPALCKSASAPHRRTDDKERNARIVVTHDARYAMRLALWIGGPEASEPGIPGLIVICIT